MTPLRVAVFGMGTVGTGVARLLLEQPERLQRRCGRRIELARVVVRNPGRPREMPLPADLLTDDPRSVMDDDSIDVAIQLIGGLQPAGELMEQLLRAGKDVVTANKALLCEHGPHLFDVARKTGRTIAFEAAVAGGIPIISAIGQALAANQIDSIEAILNGTSNYILTQMLSCGQSYQQALASAQELGYAEADPTMDVDGTDAAQKLVILTQLAFGTRIDLEQIVCQGIDQLELADLKYAQFLGYTVKLLAVAKRVDERLEMHVQPTLIRSDRPLARNDGPANMVAISGDAVGRAWFAGPGAGQMPTASAVVADLLDIAVGRAQLTFPRLDLWGESQQWPVVPATDLASRYYLRFNVEDRPHVFADIADILGRNGVSLASIIQQEAPEVEADDTVETVPVVVMTHRTTEGQLREVDAQLHGLDSVRHPLIRMPVAD